MKGLKSFGPSVTAFHKCPIWSILTLKYRMTIPERLLNLLTRNEKPERI